MPSNFVTASVVLSSAVATNGTFTVGYPAGVSGGMFKNGSGHRLIALGADLACPAGFTVSFGAALATVTYLGTTTLPIGTTVRVQFNTSGGDTEFDRYLPGMLRTGFGQSIIVDLGTPVTATATGICTSQSISSGVAASLNGALASGGVVTLDVPRALVAAWTTTAILTITGTDEYGAAVVEKSASGTGHTGKKAFKTVTSIVPNASITGATVGTGDVLGLPVFLPSTAFVVKELEDDAAPTGGTLVAGVVTAPSGTTGDVRGSYDPNSACNNAKGFRLVLTLADPTNKGLTQYAG
ncbi:conserved hypothetical protein [uncultured Gammaproteobacteria bacterium]